MYLTVVNKGSSEWGQELTGAKGVGLEPESEQEVSKGMLGDEGQTWNWVVV